MLKLPNTGNSCNHTGGTLQVSVHFAKISLREAHFANSHDASTNFVVELTGVRADTKEFGYHADIDPSCTYTHRGGTHNNNLDQFEIYIQFIYKFKQQLKKRDIF